MANLRKLLHVILTGIFLTSFSLINAQESGCIVKHPGLSGKYSGDCKNGLASGRGVAEGVDKYYGQFRNGLPHGKGTYTWIDGTYYEGQFQNGLKDGKGKMVYNDSTITGYWKADRYMGERLIPPYEITRSISVVRTNFKKLPGKNNYIRIRMSRGGSENIDLIDFSLANDSGEQYRLGPSYGIQNSQFPLGIIIRFRAWNYFHTAQFEGNFEFTINEPANWDVQIHY